MSPPSTDPATLEAILFRLARLGELPGAFVQVLDRLDALEARQAESAGQLDLLAAGLAPGDDDAAAAEARLAEALEAGGKASIARLVRHMIGRRRARFDLVGTLALDDPAASDAAVRKLASRASAAARPIGLAYRTRSGWVLKVACHEMSRAGHETPR